MSSQRPRETMRVIAVTADEAALETIERAVRSEGDEFASASEVAGAIALATKNMPHVAFVDLTTDGGAGLALVHHLPAMIPEIAIHVTAPIAQIELATQAVALGAAGMFVAPITGDDVIFATSQVRAKRAVTQRMHELEAEILRTKLRSDMLDRIVALARGGGDSNAVLAIAEAIATATGAKGVGLYATFAESGESESADEIIRGAKNGNAGECVRLAATGSFVDLPAMGKTGELREMIGERGGREVSLEASHGTLGMVVVDMSDVTIDAKMERDLSAMADVAAAVLALVDRRDRDEAALESTRNRVYTQTYFNDVAAREIEKAKRHDRRLSIAAVVVDDGGSARRPTNPNDPKSSRNQASSRASRSRAPASNDGSTERVRAELSDVLLTVVRDTDVLATLGDRELALLLPETGALGANICRRRVLIRAEGDRRAKTASNDRREPVSARPSRGLPIAIGVSTFPHDGTDVERLLRVARRRAYEQARSSVHALSLATMTLGEIVDTLLARPMVDAGLSSPYPLELAMPALISLASSACMEGRRGGAATVIVTTQPGMGLLAAARQASADANESSEISVRVVDVRTIPACGDLEAIVVSAEHGTWACCGRVNRERFRGVHAADPLLADLIAQRLAQAGGLRIG
jgi:ActR/RegA family two-component response regulator